MLRLVRPGLRHHPGLLRQRQTVRACLPGSRVYQMSAPAGQAQPTASRPQVIILTGPTAVGKTAASLALARAVNGEIISADSVQVYRGLDIGSAKVLLAASILHFVKHNCASMPGGP